MSEEFGELGAAYTIIIFVTVIFVAVVISLIFDVIKSWRKK